MAARTRCAWSKDEEDALRRAVAVHGVGNWASILSDPAFVGVFAPSRTNVDVKVTSGIRHSRKDLLGLVEHMKINSLMD